MAAWAWAVRWELALCRLPLLLSSGDTTLRRFCDAAAQAQAAEAHRAVDGEREAVAAISTQVLICGAGPAGLALAVELGTRGVKGVGEPPTVVSSAAVAAALRDFIRTLGQVPAARPASRAADSR